MNRNRYQWWGYVKAIIRAYKPAAPGELAGAAERENAAVALAVQQTLELPDGAERMELIRLVFWRRSHTLAGASLMLHISDRTGQEWHRQFIRAVAKNFGLLD